MKSTAIALLKLLAISGIAGAGLTPVFEYSFPASYDGTGSTWTDQSVTGNNGHTHNNAVDAPLTDDRPAGFDVSLMSISGSNGAHGVTDSIDLLANAAVGTAGGFTFDVWFKWEGTYTNIRKVIDYAGTESLRTQDNEIRFGLSNSTTVLSSPIVGNQWYHAVAVFDTTGNTAEADPNYPGEQRIMGDAYLFIDDVLVDSAQDVYKTGFGDSLNRTIGLNQWPNGGDWNQGRIFNPSVYLGIPDFDPVAMVTPDALDYGSFGSSPGPQTLDVTVTNDGSAQDLTINGLQILDDLDGVFSVGSPPAPIGPGGSVNLTVTFDPAALTGDFTGTLEIDTDGQKQALFTVPLTASVFDPIAVVTPATIEFGDFAASPVAQTMDVTISNDGTANDLTVSALVVVDDFDMVFSVGSPPAPISPGGSVNVTVTFDPGALDGFFTGTLQIDTDGDNQQYFDVPLSAGVKLADPAANLVSHFTFDDAGNPADDSGSYDNDGTLVGDAQRTASARVGSGALLLDGDGDLVQLAATGDDYTNQVIANFEGFTLACWAFVPNGSPSNRTRFFSAYDTTGGWGAGYGSTTEVLATTYTKADYLPTGGTAPARGDWHHIACVFRNDPISRIDYYVDGALVSSVTSGNTGITATLEDFAIGAKASTPANEYFDGRLDDLRIYDRELLGDNILDLYNTAPPLGTYDAWAITYGLDATGDGAPEVDADGDGVDNGVEFMLGTSPVDSTEGPLAASTPVDDTYTFVYQRKTEATGAGFTDVVEYGTNLVDWTTAVDGEVGVTVEVAPFDPETEEVTVTIPVTGEEKLFVRLVVLAP